VRKSNPPLPPNFYQPGRAPPRPDRRISKPTYDF
jgi:hypothetical protein